MTSLPSPHLPAGTRGWWVRCRGDSVLVPVGKGKGKGERFLEGSPSSSSTIHSGWAVAFEAIDRLAREYIRPYVYYFCTSKCLTGS
ncbi:unnamed protein product [Urochloa humidicola]